MMVVVANAIFKQCRGVHWLNATRKTLFDERVQSVVHRLPRNGAKLFACNFGSLVGSDVWVISDGLQNG
jgi:hypothetical protein